MPKMRVRPTILNKRGNIQEEPEVISQPKALKRRFDQSSNCPLCHSPSSHFVGLDYHLRHIHGKISCKGCGTLIGLNKLGFHKCHEIQSDPKNTNESNGLGENLVKDSIQYFKQEPKPIESKSKLIDQNGREVKLMDPDPSRVITKKLFYQQCLTTTIKCAKCEYYCGKICDCEKMIVKNPKIQFYELKGHEVKQMDPKPVEGTYMKKPHYKLRLDKSVSDSFQCSKCDKRFSMKNLAISHQSLDHKDCIYQTGDKNPPKVTAIQVKTEITMSEAKANEEFWNEVNYKPLSPNSIAKENEIYCDVNVKHEVMDPFDGEFTKK